jgi:zinc transport system substrate-binding protein
MYKNFLLVFSILLVSFNSHSSNNPPRIITTIPPLASMVKMIVGEQAVVTYMQKSASCPHHHSVKPTEVYDLNTSDYLLYIDDKFESYAAKNIKSNTIKKLKLSGISEITIKEKNFHIWVDPNIAIEIMEAVKEFLKRDKHFDAEQLEANFLLSKSEILEFSKITPSSNVLLVGNSLNYMRNKNNEEFVDSFGSVKGIRKFEELEKQIEKNKYKCIFFDDENDVKSLKLPESTKLRNINIEHWHVHEGELAKFYLDYLNDIYSQLNSCK